MPSEAEVEAAAKVIADTPLISEPKLEFHCWMGTARASLRAAETVRMGSSGNFAELVGLLRAARADDLFERAARVIEALDKGGKAG
jgi:hypothetical protein